MAVPKRKTGRARTHARRSENDKIASPSRSVCPQCGEVKLPHRVCPNCGFYRAREVFQTAYCTPLTCKGIPRIRPGDFYMGWF